MTACEYPTYKDYCEARAKQGLQVIPEKLYNALRVE